jgi:hypothetical protein
LGASSGVDVSTARSISEVDSFRRLTSHQAVADSEPIEPQNAVPTKSPQGCSKRIVGLGWPSPLSLGEGCNRQGRTGYLHLSASLGSKEDGMVAQTSGERGKVSDPAKRVPYGKGRSYNRKAGSRAEGPRLAAEDGVSDDARRNEPWKSQGPLGEGGSEAEEMVGTQRPISISLTCWAKAVANRRERC